MPSECVDCQAAAREVHHGFRAGCRGCCARSIARSQQAFEARKTGAQTRGYRGLLAQVGGLVDPKLTHDDVKAAAAADAALRERQAAGCEK